MKTTILFRHNIINYNTYFKTMWLTVVTVDVYSFCNGNNYF